MKTLPLFLLVYYMIVASQSPDDETCQVVDRVPSQIVISDYLCISAVNSRALQSGSGPLCVGLHGNGPASTACFVSASGLSLISLNGPSPFSCQNRLTRGGWVVPDRFYGLALFSVDGGASCRSPGDVHAAPPPLRENQEVGGSEAAVETSGSV